MQTTYPKVHADLCRLLAAAESNSLVFQDVMDTIRRHYECRPAAFTTGDGTPMAVVNPAGTNSGSCQLLAFARRLGLGADTTLALYGEHYRSVLADPCGTAHPNIRAFMANGWAGVRFGDDPLRLRGPGN
jgi:hypothetical protein